MNCEDVPTGEDWGDVTDEQRETLAQSLIKYYWPIPDGKQIGGTYLRITNIRVPEGF